MEVCVLILFWQLFPISSILFPAAYRKIIGDYNETKVRSSLVSQLHVYADCLQLYRIHSVVELYSHLCHCYDVMH